MSYVVLETNLNNKNSCVNNRSTVRLMRKRFRSVGWLLTILVLLAGCGPTSAAPQPTLMPLLPQATRTPRQGPPPTVVVQNSDAELKGRILFVRAGDVWLWQGSKGSAIIDSGHAFQPAWSPDGSRIAYINRTESASDLLVMDVEGGEPLWLTNDGSNSSRYSYERIYSSIWAFYPAWSPDGSEIAFVSQAGPPYGSPAAEYRLTLYVIAANNPGGRIQFYANDRGHVGDLAYAPDGDTIVFSFAPVNTDPPLLYRIQRATGQAEPFPNIPEYSNDPAFSPDGRWLAFTAPSPQGTDAFVVPADGGEPIQLTTLGGVRAPTFSPDGSQLAFLALAPGSTSFELWVADLATNANQQLVAQSPRQITNDMRIDADSGLSWAR
jgi:TolB protein